MVRLYEAKNRIRSFENLIEKKNVYARPTPFDFVREAVIPSILGRLDSPDCK